MKAIEILAEEHQHLFRVLACLERLLEETVQTDHLDAELAMDIVEFLERYADGCHQEKEEKHLFPRLMESAPAELAGVVREIFGAHERERALLEQLRGNLEAATHGDSASLADFVDRGRAYAAMQREHAEQEDRVLLPLAESLLGRADDAEMVVGFQRIERRYLGLRPVDPSDVVDALHARLRGRRAAVVI